MTTADPYLDPQDPRGSPNPGGKASQTVDWAAQHITRSNAKFTDVVNGKTVITYSFLEHEPQVTPTSSTYMPNGTSGFSAFNAAQRAQAELAMASWADVANVRFESTIGGYYTDVDITFANYNSGAAGAGAFAYLPGGPNKGVWVNSTEGTNLTPANLNYGRSTLTHEIGHALGLSHPGDYNAGSGGTITYAGQAEYKEDTLQYTVMSCFREDETGGNFGNAMPSAPMLDDIAAIQRLYGANMSTRTGNDTYGFSSNTGKDYYSTTSQSQKLIFAVWDAGGIDTFNFSGYSDNQRIDLRELHFSNVGGFVGNVSIAKGVTIENAIGGGGDDLIIGNDVDNSLSGGGGGDVFIGSNGNDQVDGGSGYNILNFASYGSAINCYGSYVEVGLVLIDDGMGGGYYSSVGTVCTNIQEIIGTRNNDTFYLGGDGASKILGFDGDDTFQIGPLQSGTSLSLDGGMDHDVIDLTRNQYDPATSIVFDMGLSKITFSTGGQLVFANMDDVILGHVRATLVGTGDGDTIDSGNGNETVLGGAGDDTIHGKALDPGASRNTLDGGTGDDTIDSLSAAIMRGGSGSDVLNGSSQADNIDTGIKVTNAQGVILEDDDVVNAGDGRDVITGFSGHDVVNGGAGWDEYVISSSPSSVEFRLVGGGLVLARGNDDVVLTQIEAIRIINPFSSAPDTYLKVADVVATLQSAQNASLGYSALVSAMTQSGHGLLDNGTVHTFEYAGEETPGGSIHDIEGDAVGGTVTYAGTTGVTVTMRDYPEPGHVATVTGNGISNKLFNIDGIKGSGQSDVFNLAGGALAGLMLDGNGGDDLLTFVDVGTGAHLVVDAVNGTIDGLGDQISFANMGSIFGSAGNDTFYLDNKPSWYWQYLGMTPPSVVGGGGVDTVDFSRSQWWGGEIETSDYQGIANFVGSNGDDEFKLTAHGHSVDGGSGRDTASYAGGPAITYQNGTISANGAIDVLTSIERIVGTSGVDTFHLRSGVEIVGGGGADHYYAGGVSGSVSDGGGSGIIHLGQSGTTRVTSWWGAMTDGAGNSFRGMAQVIGSAGDDTFVTEGNVDGRTGLIDGAGGFNHLVVKDYDFAGYNMATGSYSTYTVINGQWGTQAGLTIANIDEVTTAWGTITGTSGSDMVRVTTYGGTYEADAVVYGGGGSDNLSTIDNGTNATLHGEDGNDVLSSLGYDSVFGDGGADLIYGGDHTRSISGGDGDDTIYTAPTGFWLTEVRGGTGTNHIHASGDPRYTEVHYDFTKSMTDNSGYYGDGGGLISARDLGGVFEIVTTQGTDYISGVANLMFQSPSNNYGWVHEAFYLAPGLNYYDGMFH